MNEPTNLRHSLELFLKNLGAPPVHIISSLAECWDEIIGPALGAVTTPICIQDNVLEISCEDSAWASQISWMEAQIKEKFEERFPENSLDSIRVSVAK